jgi:hypothetical protein
VGIAGYILSDVALPDLESSSITPLLKAKTRLRPLVRPLPRRPQRVDLERACRIALMEIAGPASVEIIYDCIVRRGSVTFLGYKRPFRAIASAMSGLTKKGEASVIRRSVKTTPSRRSHQSLWFRTEV